MTRKSLRFALPGLLLLPLIAAAYGGWASVTMEDLPEYLVAQQPTALAFTIRQHGISLLGGLNPKVEARSGNTVITAVAAASRMEGRYTASLTVPAAGDWTVTIHTGFGANSSTLLPLAAIEQGKRPPATLAQDERGRRLFVAKGCVTCHTHRAVNDKAVVEVGPDLTGRHFPPEYLAQFLANPAMIPPRRGSMGMPNLGLKQAEIAALATFINAEQQALR